MGASLEPSVVPRANRPFSTTVKPFATLRKIAIVGFGTVGSSVARILSENPHASLRLAHVCTRNVEARRVAWLSSRVAWTQNFEDVLASDADVVVELIGGLNPAADWVRRSLECGKSEIGRAHV